MAECPLLPFCTRLSFLSVAHYNVQKSHQLLCAGRVQLVGLLDKALVHPFDCVQVGCQILHVLNVLVWIDELVAELAICVHDQI